MKDVALGPPSSCAPQKGEQEAGDYKPGKKEVYNQEDHEGGNEDRDLVHPKAKQFNGLINGSREPAHRGLACQTEGSGTPTLKYGGDYLSKKPENY